MYSNDAVRKRALAKLIQSAENGDSNAQFKIGIDYLQGGRFFKRNDKEALKWLNLSAEQGHKESQDVLMAYAEFEETRGKEHYILRDGTLYKFKHSDIYELTDEYSYCFDSNEWTKESYITILFAYAHCNSDGDVDYSLTLDNFYSEYKISIINENEIDAWINQKFVMNDNNEIDVLIDKFFNDEGQCFINEMSTFRVENDTWALILYNVNIAKSPQRVELHERKNNNKRYVIPFSDSGFDFSQLGKVPDSIVSKVKKMLSRPNVLKLVDEYWTDRYASMAEITKALGF